jgi:hypothetical protein
MARAKKHKDVEFHLSSARRRGQSYIVDTWDEAAGIAIAVGLSRGINYVIDVVIWSKAGARWWQGDEGVEWYEEDPEASVFERIVVSAKSEGRIP